jgi:hypothetical protein
LLITTYVQIVTKAIKRGKFSLMKFFLGSKGINLLIFPRVLCVKRGFSQSMWYLFIRIYIVYDNYETSLDIRETVNLLSPVVLLKEVENLIKNQGEKYFFITEWYKHKDHKQIFWNIVNYFNVLGLPTVVLTYVSDELILRDILEDLQRQRGHSLTNKNESIYYKACLSLNSIGSSQGLNLKNVFEGSSNGVGKLTTSNGWEIINFKM